MVAVVVGVGIAGAVTVWHLTGEGSDHADSVVPLEGAPILGELTELSVESAAGTAAATPGDASRGVTASGESLPENGPLPDSADPDEATLTDPPLNTDGVRILSFDLLASFDYEVAMDTPEEAVARRWQMPDVIRRLDGQRVEIEGYMLPLDFERGRVQSFYLNRDTNACCFGIIPPVNQVIRVHLPDKKGVPNYSNIPIIVTGKFRVTESAGEFGFVTSIFRIDADTVEKSTWQ